MQKLLVSVRDFQEATLVAQLGVPIVDFKEPAAGSLGMPASEILRDVIPMLREQHPDVISSVACGEVLDWRNDNKKLLIKLPPVNFLKLGLAGLKRIQDWQQAWLKARQRVEASLDHPQRVGWVAVAYVDHERANSPAIDDVITAAVEHGCRGVLFDTFQKDETRFSDWVDQDRIKEYLAAIHSAGLFCSVAGRLTMEDVERLARTDVDVIAVRSAACESRNRTGRLSKDKVQKLMRCLSKESITSS